MTLSEQSLVDCAIEGGRGVVVTVNPEGKALSFMGQFYRRYDDCFIFQAGIMPRELTRDSIKDGLEATFTFGVSGAAVQFQAKILTLESGYPNYVRCGSATDINVFQRRNHFRVPASSQALLDLTVWKIPEHWVLRDRPKPSMQFRSELVDLSIGGMCLHILPHRTGPDTVAIGDRLRIDFTENGDTTMIDGQIVYRSEPREDGSIRVGVCFRLNPDSIESRRADSLLNRLIANLQRKNIKLAAATESA